MFEKILQKLKQQRGTTAANVTDRTLEDLARSLETVINTDELLEKADFTNAIKSVQGNLNKYASDAVIKAQEDAKKKAEEDEARKRQEEIDKKKKTTKGNEEDEPPAWAKALIDQNEKLTQSVAAMQTEKVTGSRKSQVEKTLEGLPDFYTGQVLGGFSNLNFENDENFTTYLEGVKTNAETFKQRAKEAGLNVIAPSKEVEKPDPDEKGTSALNKALKTVRDEKAKKD